MKERKNIEILSSFWIKVIAAISMTLDHLGIFLNFYGVITTDSILFFALRILGRLALPLFIFLLVEGINHSKNLWRYILRLSIGLVLVLVPTLILNRYYSLHTENPFVDLVIIALFLTLIRQKDWKKFLAILPLGYAILSSVIYIYSFKTGAEVHWLPDSLRCAYGIYALALALGFELAIKIANKNMKPFEKQYEASLNDLQQTSYYIFLKKGLCSCSIVVVNVLFWVLFAFIFKECDYLNISIQTYSIFAFVPLIFYNGKLGYNKPWFKYGMYLYFDLHILILYIILQLSCVGTLF